MVAMVPDDWGPLWQPRHHVVSRLAERFPVIWMSPARGWREAARARFRAPAPDPVPVAGLEIDTSGWRFPKVYHPRWLGALLFRWRLRRAAARLRRRGCHHVILYLWRPAWRLAIGAYPWSGVVYHVDDEYTFAPVGLDQDPEEVNPEEAALLREADLVCIHSDLLFTRKGPLARRAIRTPNGVDYDRFSAPAPEPDELARVPRPRLGYVGWLKAQIDWALLEELARRHPEWSWVLLGPIKPDPDLVAIIERIDRLPNVHLFPAQPARQLASWVQHLDVALLPYIPDGYTQYIYPMKLHEYLAAGRPVVATPLPALQRHRDILSLASGVEEWSEALREALRPGALHPDTVAHRQSVARAHDWDAIVETIADALRDLCPSEPPARRAPE